MAAHTNFQFHKHLEILKANYAPFDPDAVRRPQSVAEVIASETKEDRFMRTLAYTLECANFVSLSEMAIQEAIANSALLDLKAEVDFDDFDQIIFYYRGATPTTLKVKRWYLNREITAEVYSKVVLGIKFKEATYFQERKRDPKKLNFTPGLMYLYLYKDVPKYDLELLFPNVGLHMNLLDRIIFLSSAIAAGISVLMKALPNLALIAGIILFLTLGPAFAERIGVQEAQIHQAATVLLALLSVGVALGGFAVSQYFGYQNKRIKFLKDVTETLFFKNLATNASVFYNVIDSAEEEETKEIILIYYHLLTQQATGVREDGFKLTVAQLDAKIESWLATKTASNLNFDVERTVAHMQQLRAPLDANLQPIKQTHGCQASLLSTDAQGHCQVLPLPEAKRVLDWIWDHEFQYSNTVP